MKARIPELTTGPELADLLGIGERHLRKLAEKGVVVRAAEGGYEVAASVRGYREHVLQTARARHGSGVDDRLRLSKVEMIERRMAREDRGLLATVEAVDGIDLIVSIFDGALDDLAVKLAPYALSDTAPVLAEIRRELAQKRGAAVEKLERG